MSSIALVLVAAVVLSLIAAASLLSVRLFRRSPESGAVLVFVLMSVLSLFVALQVLAGIEHVYDRGALDNLAVEMTNMIDDAANTDKIKRCLTKLSADMRGEKSMLDSLFELRRELRAPSR